MGKLLQVLFIIALVIYVVGIIFRFVMRGWIRRKTAEFGADQRTGNRNKKKEGEVSVKRVDEKKKRVSDGVGDYVEFEEIDKEDK